MTKELIIGLFSDDQDLEKAMAQLQASEFGQPADEMLKVIDKQRLLQQDPIDPPSQTMAAQPNRAVSASHPAVVANPQKSANTQQSGVEKSAYQTLTGLGVAKEEASFFAKHIARGSSVVAIETDEERAKAAVSILEGTNARTAIYETSSLL